MRSFSLDSKFKSLKMQVANFMFCSMRNQCYEEIESRLTTTSESTCYLAIFDHPPYCGFPESRDMKRLNADQDVAAVSVANIGKQIHLIHEHHFFIHRVIIMYEPAILPSSPHLTDTFLSIRPARSRK